MPASPRRSMNYYPWHSKPVLRRPLEPKEYTSGRMMALGCCYPRGAGVFLEASLRRRMAQNVIQIICV